jgi:RNA polymerase sigma-70 factor (ECF subfamily)
MTPRQLADLIAAHAAALVLFARQWCDSPEDAAEDAAQEAYCRLVTLRSPPDDPAGWLFRTTRNAAIDAGRSARRRLKREQATARPVRWFAETEVDGLDAKVAVAALEALAPDQPEVAAQNGGKFPPSLEATGLPVPVDPFTRKAFVYELKDATAIIRATLPADQKTKSTFNRMYKVIIRK